MARRPGGHFPRRGPRGIWRQKTRPSSPGALVTADTDLDEDDARSSLEIELDALSPSLAPPSLPPPVAELGRYEILGRLAFGGMADIFLGQEAIAGGGARQAVVKVLRQHLVADDEFEAMFLREGRVAMQLSHPNICTVYEFGKWAGHYFIAMEYIEGATLKELMQSLGLRGEQLPPALAASIIARVAAGLEYAHTARDSRRQRLGVVHRDVSPQNIMIRYDGVVKLLDFGVAKVAQAEEETKSDAVKGKFSYLAPEQCTAGKVDPRSDVFSLGICFFEALTGKRLYRRESQYDTFHAIVSEPAPSIRSIDSSLPAELDLIVARALAKRPADRYQSAADMQQAIAKWLAKIGAVTGGSRLRDQMKRLFAEEMRAGPSLDTSDSVIERLLPLAQHAVISSIPPSNVVVQSKPASPPPSPPPAPRKVASPVAFDVEVDLPDVDEAPARKSKLPLVLLAAVLTAGAVGGFLFWQSSTESTRAGRPSRSAPAETSASEQETVSASAEAGEEAGQTVEESGETGEESSEAAPVVEPTETAVAEDEREAAAIAEERPSAMTSMTTRPRRPREDPRTAMTARMRPGFVANPGF